MTKASKVLAVFTAVVSIAFLAFVSASSVGGPNWEAQMRADDLRDFVFEPSEDDAGVVSWTVKERLTDAPLGSASSVAARPIISARVQLQNTQQIKLGDLETDIEELTSRLKETKEFIEVDIKAVELRLGELKAELEVINNEIEDATKVGLQKAENARQKQLEATELRGEVVRYINQLEEILTDKYRTIEQQRVLRDRLIRVRSNNERLDRRSKRMRDAGASLGGN